MTRAKTHAMAIWTGVIETWTTVETIVRKAAMQSSRSSGAGQPLTASWTATAKEAEQLRRNPSLVNNQQFVQSHPALQSYLQQNPNVRQAITQDPNAFMRQENQYDRREDMNRGHSMEAANFRDFLGNHSNISKDLVQNPGKANDANYQKSQSGISGLPERSP